MRIPKQVSLKAAIALILCSVLLVSGVLYYVWAAAPSSTFWLAPGVYPGAPTFTFWREGNNYFAKDANGEIQYSGTVASTVIQSAFNSVTSGEFFFKANIFSITAPLVLDGRSKSVIGEAGGIDTSTTTTKFYLANGANCHVFVVGSTTAVLSRDMQFKHFTIEGNKANNPTGGSGIFVNCSVNQEEGFIEDVMVFDTAEAGFSINAGYWTLFQTTADSCDGEGYYINGTDCYISDGDAYSNNGTGFRYDVGGIYSRTSDSRAYVNVGSGFNATAERTSFLGCRAGSNGGDGFFLYNANQSKICSSYSLSNTGDGIEFLGGNFANIIADCTIWNNGGDGIKLDSDGTNVLYHLSITGNHISFSGQNGINCSGMRDSNIGANTIVDNGRTTNGTYVGLYLSLSGAYGGSQITVVENKIQDYTGVNRTKWGLYEAAGCNYNMLVANAVYGQTLINIWVVGANTECHSSFNGTTWVT